MADVHATIRLKQLGFFDRLRPEDRRNALEQQARSASSPNKDLVLRYLRQGHPMFAYAGFTRDFLAASEPVIGGIVVKTDGIWAWTSDVEHYVEAYNLELPIEFVSLVVSRNGNVPQVENLDRLIVDL